MMRVPVRSEHPQQQLLSMYICGVEGGDTGYLLDRKLFGGNGCCRRSVTWEFVVFRAHIGKGLVLWPFIALYTLGASCRWSQ